MSHRRSLAVLPLALTALSTAQAAFLDGTAVTLRYELGATQFSDPLTVGAGTEITCPPPAGAHAVCGALTVPRQTVDFSDTAISYLFTSATGAPAPFVVDDPNRFIFDDLDEPGFVLAGATISSPLDFTGRLSFDSRSVALNMSGLTFASGEGFTIDLTFRDVGQVPVPGTALLAGLGLAGLALRRRVS